jgi:hypothetical protein
VRAEFLRERDERDKRRPAESFARSFSFFVLFEQRDSRGESEERVAERA